MDKLTKNILVRNPNERYELIHLSDLGNYETPNFQRFIMPDKVNAMAEEMIAAYRERRNFHMPGCIIVAKEQTPNGVVTRILDGQHRLKALSKYIETTGDNPVFMCNFIYTNSHEETRRIFDMINSHTHIPELPENVEINDVKELMDLYHTRHPSIFSCSNNPQRPNISYTGFQEFLGRLFSQGLRRREIEEKIERANSAIRDAHWSLLIKDNSDDESKITKFRVRAVEKGGFYLGVVHNLDKAITFADRKPELERNRVRLYSMPIIMPSGVPAMPALPQLPRRQVLNEEKKSDRQAPAPPAPPATSKSRNPLLPELEKLATMRLAEQETKQAQAPPPAPAVASPSAPKTIEREDLDEEKEPGSPVNLEPSAVPANATVEGSEENHDEEDDSDVFDLLAEEVNEMMQKQK
jgi:hypothetical protein